MTSVLMSIYVQSFSLSEAYFPNGFRKKGHGHENRVHRRFKKLNCDFYTKKFGKKNGVKFAFLEYLKYDEYTE